jgi:hypothetical protein
VRVLLDTNIWSRLADQGQQDPFVRLAREIGLEVVVPPATLLEIIRSQGRAARRTRVRLVCRTAWLHLKAEAESEAAELVEEIGRLRPEWLLDQPDVGRIAELERFWLQDIWELARREHTSLLQLAQTKGAAERASILKLQREQQAKWREDRFIRSLEDLRKNIRALQLGVGPDPVEVRNAERSGWKAGTLVEPWRYAVLVPYWDALAVAPVRSTRTGEHTTYADWVGSYVDLNAIRRHRKEFGHLVLYQIAEAKMPRAWLRWAVNFAQHFVRIGVGNPVDAQLAPYLVEADFFMTNDRRLARIIETVRPSAPSACAVGVYVDIKGAGGSVLNAVRKSLAECEPLVDND